MGPWDQYPQHMLSKYTGDVTDLEVKRLLFMTDWCGPWERLMALTLGIRREDNTLRFAVEDLPWILRKPLDVASDWLDRRDIAWRHRHADRGIAPWRIWRRRRLTEIRTSNGEKPHD